MTAIDTSTEAVERLLDGVTPGPWAVDEGRNYCDVVTDYGAFDEDFVICEHAHRDARFIAAARDLIPALLKERDEARAALAASQPADPVTNAGCRQPVKVKPLEWQAFANISAAPDDDATMDDNLAVALCSYFDSRMDCPDDEEEGAELDEYDCWKVWVSENAEKVLRRIAKAANDHILAALDRMLADAEAEASANALRRVVDLPHRIERLGGQNYAYVRVEEILALIPKEGEA